MVSVGVKRVTPKGEPLVIARSRVSEGENSRETRLPRKSCHSFLVSRS